MAEAVGEATFIRNSFDYLFLDEAAFIPRRQMDEFLSGMYAGCDNPKIVIASTPNGFNTFCKVWHDAMCNYNNFRPVKLPYTIMDERDDEWKEKETRILGKDRFVSEYECEFIDRNKYAV